MQEKIWGIINPGKTAHISRAQLITGLSLASRFL